MSLISTTGSNARKLRQREPMRYFIQYRDREWTARPETTTGSTKTFELQPSDGADTRRHEIQRLTDSTLLVDGQVVRVAAREQLRPGVLRLDLEIGGDAPRSVVVESERARSLAFEAGSAELAAHEVKSPMPGRVLELLVSEGDSVERGAPLLVVEAMKMENQVNAERSGTVERLVVKTGDAVESGQVLLIWKQ